MKKFIRINTVSILMVFVIMVLVSCNSVNEEFYDRDGDFIFMGEYPQTLALADAISGMGTEVDDDGYYTSSYDSERYAKVVATPYERGYTFSNEEEVINGETYYFKVEPIKWRIVDISGKKALLLAEILLDNSKYDFDDCNWENSDIRNLLNNNFYNKAFNDSQQGIIETSLVDNSIGTGFYTNTTRFPYIEQNDTNDKVFLLSFSDTTNSSYGFASNSTTNDKLRRAYTSDYSRSKGIWVRTESSDLGNGFWWLRSPGAESSKVSSLYVSGIINDTGENVGYSYYGIRPAIIINL